MKRKRVEGKGAGEAVPDFKPDAAQEKPAMAQEPSTAEYGNMPRGGIAGLVDYVLPPDKMPGQPIAYAAHAYGKKPRPIAPPAGKAEEALAVGDLKLAEALALARIGHWEYDPATNRTEWSSTMYEIFARDPLRGPPSLREEEGYFTPEQRRRS